VSCVAEPDLPIKLSSKYFIEKQKSIHLKFNSLLKAKNFKEIMPVKIYQKKTNSKEVKTLQAPEDFTYTISLLSDQTGLVIQFENFDLELIDATIRISNTGAGSIEGLKSVSNSIEGRLLLESSSFYGENEIEIDSVNYYNPENAATEAIE
jgi:hypothetical protein